MKKILLSLICFCFCLVACGKASDNAVFNEDGVQIKEARSSDADALFEAGQAKLKQSDLQGAIDDFTASLAIQESNYVRGDLGRTKFEKGDLQGAIDDLTASLAVQEIHYVRADLGRAKEAIGDLQGALIEYTKAIETENRGLYYEWRSNLYTKLGQTAEAQADMAEYEKLPKD